MKTPAFPTVVITAETRALVDQFAQIIANAIEEKSRGHFWLARGGIQKSKAGSRIFCTIAPAQKDLPAVLPEKGARS
jgi:hypothetical protein